MNLTFFGLLILTFADYFSYVWGLVLLRLGVSYSYVCGLVILAFKGYSFFYV